MRAVKRYISRNWFWIALGLILTRKAVEYAYADRGYLAIGSEWFVLPAILFIVQFAREVLSEVLQVMK